MTPFSQMKGSDTLPDRRGLSARARCQVECLARTPMDDFGRTRHQNRRALPLSLPISIVLTLLAWALAGTGPVTASNAFPGHSLAPRQNTAGLPNNTVDCPTFRFTTPMLPAFTSRCTGSGSRVTLRTAGIILAASPSTALEDCETTTGRFEFTDADGTTWLLDYDTEDKAFKAIDQMFRLDGSEGRDLVMDENVCGDKDSEILFAQTVLPNRLLRLELRCSNDAYQGFLYFRWSPTGVTPAPANLSSFTCDAPAIPAFNFVTGNAYFPSASTTRRPTTSVRSSTTISIAGILAPTTTTVRTATVPAVAADLPPPAATSTLRTTTTASPSRTMTTTTKAAVVSATGTGTGTSTAAPLATNGLAASCPTFAAGTNPPSMVNLATSFVGGNFTYEALSRNVPGRSFIMYLGDDPSIRVCRATVVPPANASDCMVRQVLKGSWAQLRSCTWKEGRETNGFIGMTNAVRIAWNDSFPGPLGVPNIVDSALFWSIEINLPTVIYLQADVSTIQESGIKNFNFTGLFFTTKDDGSRALVLDYQMWSYWPNKLGYDTISSLPFTPAGPLTTVEMQGPDISLCQKNPPEAAVFTTKATCWQFGSIEIPLGDVCDVSGPYTFTFDSGCFDGARPNNDCTGTKLSANALIEGVDLCASLLATAGNVTGNVTLDKPDGYVFGDTVRLNVTFQSPDVPLFESRLMSAEVVIKKFRETAIILYTQAGGNAVLGRNTNFTVEKDGLLSPYNVLLALTPNMMPTFAAGAFLTTDDFDTADNDFTFRLRFRVFFDALSAGSATRRRRRRAYFREVEMTAGKLEMERRQAAAPTIGSIAEIQVGAQSSMQVPNVTVVLQNNPELIPGEAAGTQTAPAAATPSYIWAIVGVAAGVILLGGLGFTIWCCTKQKRRDNAQSDWEEQALMANAAKFGMSSPYDIGSTAWKVPSWPGDSSSSGRAPDVSGMFGMQATRMTETSTPLISKHAGAVDVSNLFPKV